jgi:hypothetical protein
VLGINIRGKSRGGRCFLNAELKRAAKPPVAPERVIDISAAFARFTLEKRWISTRCFIRRPRNGALEIASPYIGLISETHEAAPLCARQLPFSPCQQPTLASGLGALHQHQQTSLAELAAASVTKDSAMRRTIFDFFGRSRSADSAALPDAP